MKLLRLLRLPCFVLALVNTPTLEARDFEGARANSILLNGQWESVAGDGSEGAETAAGQQMIHWEQVSLAGPFNAPEGRNETKS